MATIMVTLDGTVHAEQALPYARGRAQEADEILLVRVVEPGHPSRDSHHLKLQLEQDFQEAERYLSRLATRLRERGARVRTLVLGGPAARELPAAAAREEVQLIVMSCHGRTGPGRLVLGSVTESTVRDSPCPVWVARGDEHLVDLSEPWRVPPAPVRRVLLPLDGSQEAERALDFVEPLTPGELILITATRPQQGDDTASYLERRGLPFWKKGWQVRAQVSELFPAEAIVQEMEAARPDLVVMATHGRRGLERWCLGSVAERVMRRANCSVVLVPPRDKPSGDEKGGSDEKRPAKEDRERAQGAAGV